MPLHFRITSKSNPSESQLRFDLTEEQLQQRFLSAYREGRPIVVGGKTIPPADINRIQIIETDHSSDRFAEWAPVLARNSDDWFVNERGKDVTDNFIDGPPGNCIPPGRCTDIRRVFVGHGRNPVWSRVVAYLKDELRMDTEAFETTSHTSEHIIDILKGFLERCDAAVIVMTADDLTAEGTTRARQNVIHEIGLFQGRHGFDRVILFQQVGTEDFSNIAGLQTIKFQQRVEDGFYELARSIQKLANPRMPNTPLQPTAEKRGG
jgi:hypothetical protein